MSNYQSQFEKLFKAEAPTWETHGNLMVIICFIWLVITVYCNIDLKQISILLVSVWMTDTIKEFKIMLFICFFKTERQVSLWFLQCLREQSLILEIIFLYYAYFEMNPSDLLSFTKMFKEQGFGLRQTNRHLVDKSMDALVERIG